MQPWFTRELWPLVIYCAFTCKQLANTKTSSIHKVSLAFFILCETKMQK